MPGRRKGPPHDKTDWSLSGRGVDVACCMVFCIHGWLRKTEDCPPSLARSAGAQSGLIHFKLMSGELAFKGANVLLIEFSLCGSSCDSGELLKWRLLGFL